MPPSWSRANPVDIIGDADALRYAGALGELLADKANDAILVMNVPTALASAPVAAATIVETIKRDRTHHDPPTDLILAHSSKDIVDISQPLNRVADLRFTISSEEGLD